MKCDNCKSEIESGVLYCPNCGKSVELVPIYNELEEELLFKLVEDKDNTGKDKFATGVYQPVNIPVEESKEKELSSKKNTVNKNILAICLIIVFIVAAIVSIILGVVFLKHSNSYEYKIEKAIAYSQDGDYTNALPFYKDALALDEDSFEAKYGIAVSYFNVGKYEECIEYFMACIESESENTELYIYLAKAYSELGDEDSLYDLYQLAPSKEIKLTISSYIIVPPDFNIEEGEYDTEQILHLTSIDDYKIYYTTNGKDPKTSGIIYRKYLTLKEGTTTVKAVCLSDDGKYSEVVTKTYDIVYKNPDKPEVSLEPGKYPFPTVLTVTNIEEGCRCYYTFDGSVPTTNSYLYVDGFKIPYGSNVIKIIIVNEDNLCSDVFSGAYVSN